MIMMWCYPRLREVRKEHKLNQTQIAELLGTSQKQYSRYETGVHELPVHHLITLAKFYHVTMDYLAGLSNVKSHDN